MISEFADRKSRDRLPHDSGEWLAVPLRFRPLPPSADPRLRRKLLLAGAGNALVQAALLALNAWVAIEYYREKDLPAVMAVATVIGLGSSTAAGAWIARRFWLDTPDTIAALMRAQAWWCLLILVPCYGWGALFVLGLPCVFGTFFGAGLGAKLGRREGC